MASQRTDDGSSGSLLEEEAVDGTATGSVMSVNGNGHAAASVPSKKNAAKYAALPTAESGSEPPPAAAIEHSKWTAQYRALMKKHWIQTRQHKKQTLAQICSPVLVTILLVIMQQISNYVLNHSEPSPPSEEILPLQRCIPGGNQPTVEFWRTDTAKSKSSAKCQTIVYAPQTDVIDKFMRRVASENGLSFDEDFLRLPGLANLTDPDIQHWCNSSTTTSDEYVYCDPTSGDLEELLNNKQGEDDDGIPSPFQSSSACLPCGFVLDNDTLTNWILNHPNFTQNVVLFPMPYLACSLRPFDLPWTEGICEEFLGKSLSTNSYVIYYNYTIGEYPFFENDHAMEVKRALEKVHLSSCAGNDVVHLDVNWRQYPTPKPRLKGYDVVAANGGVWFYLPPMIIFFVILTEVVDEKASKLRIGMKQMGLRDSVFWAAWFTYGVIMCLISSLLLCICGVIADFSIFVNSNFVIPLFLFFIFGVAMVAISFFLSTYISRTRTAQTVGYSIVLMGFVFQAIMSSGYGALVDMLYDPDIASWVRIVRGILTMYPPFNMAKMFYDISAKAGSELDFTAGMIVTGSGFHISDLSQGRQTELFGYDIHIPPPQEALAFLVLNTIVFVVWGYYQDIIFTGDQGPGQHPLFFMSPLKRLCCRRHTNKTKSTASAFFLCSFFVLESVPLMSTLPVKEDINDPGVCEEERVAADKKDETGNSILVRIVDLVKIYNAQSSILALPWRLLKGICKFVVARTYALTWGNRVYILSCCNSRSRKAATVYNDPQTVGINSVMPEHEADRETLLGEYSYFSRRLCCRRHSKSDKMEVDSLQDTGHDPNVVAAVNGMSFTVKKDEIFCLLGHNGAGKTTTLSILTGLFQATSGSVEVMGLDVGTGADVRSAQKCMGVCPQHDILWAELSACEHLRVFAAIKGLRGDDEAREREIERVLRFVDLWDVRDRTTNAFSGGMKRRLSLAISAIGDPQVLYLDEPTTGMDPVNRRQAWRLIQSLKTNRAVILTTHDMVEAETLSDRVGIMANGRLYALGTTLRLKNKYGSGYRLNLTLAQPKGNTQEQAFHKELARRIMEFLRRRLGENHDSKDKQFASARTNAVRLINQDTGAITVGLPPDERYITSFLQLLQELEGRSTDHCPEDLESLEKFRGSPLEFIREWGVSHTSLEDVFITVSRIAQFELAVESNSDWKEDGVDSEELEVGVKHDNIGAESTLSDHSTPQSFSYRALIRKNITLQLRQRGLCLCQIIAPLTVIGLLVLLQYIVKSEVGDTKEALVPSLIVPLNLNDWNDFSTSLDSHSFDSVFNSLRLTPYQSSQEAAGFSHSPASRRLGIDNGKYGNSLPGNESDCFMFFYYTVSPDTGGSSSKQELRRKVGSLDKDGSGSGLLGTIPQSNCTLKNESSRQVPFFEWRISPETAYKDLYSILESFDDISIHDIQRRPPCASGSCPAYELPDGYLDFHDLRNESNPRLAYTFSVNDVKYIPYHRPNNFTRLGIPDLPSWVQRRGVTITPARLGLMNYVSLSFEKHMCGGHTLDIPSSWMDNPLFQLIEQLLETRAVATLPVKESQNPMQIVEVFGSFLYPIALTLQLPLYIYVMVLEKETRLIELQKIMGMRWASYVLTTYGLNMSIYATVVGFFWIIGTLLGFGFFVGTNNGALFLLFLGWGLALVSLGFFLASFISSRRVATVVGYIVALFGNLVALVLSDGIYGNIPPFSIAHRLPGWLYIFPVFGFVRPIYLMNFACIFRRHCLGEFHEAMNPDSEITVAIASLYACSVGYMVLALYLEQVLPREYGVPKHPLFCCSQPIQHNLSKLASLVYRKLSSLASVVSSLFPWNRRPKYHKTPSLCETGAETHTSHLEMIANTKAQLVSSGRVRFSDGYTQTPEGSNPLLRDLIHSISLADVTDRDRAAATELQEELGILTHTEDDLDALAYAVREDIGVIDERIRVESLISQCISADGHNMQSDRISVILHHLRKVYAGSSPVLKNKENADDGRAAKVAVSDTSLAISKGECFGLLGENGAGKTTLISMLSGVFPPTSGQSWIGKYNVETETDLTHLLTGLCPQHDILWEDLTVEEHLLFFSRLKGIPPRHEKQHVDRSLNSVGLANVRRRYAKKPFRRNETKTEYCAYARREVRGRAAR
eukprot:gb/GECG01011582.1/.p1 GENE.gb/GECG01011582.1/~~gb/GECG01011582.1/.p1  ORF type:complete len:2138 (+),score=187.49 gb/GECG01011582.1/:1-6414(+)